MLREVSRATVPPVVQLIQPVLTKPFHRDGWVYEDKYDGWRAQFRTTLARCFGSARSRYTLSRSRWLSRFCTIIPRRPWPWSAGSARGARRGFVSPF
jgi:hypothetical protein